MFGNYTELLGKQFSCRDNNFEMLAQHLLIDGLAQITIKNIFNCMDVMVDQQLIKEPKLEMQVFQIYNDEVKDLLSSKEFIMNKPGNDKLKFDNRKDHSKQACKLKNLPNGNY